MHSFRSCLTPTGAKVFYRHMPIASFQIEHKTARVCTRLLWHLLVDVHTNCPEGKPHHLLLLQQGGETQETPV